MALYNPFVISCVPRSLLLVGNQCEALVSNDLHILALLLHILSNSLLVAITKLELLVNEAVLFQELVYATLGDVLNHVLVQVGSLLS